MQTTQIIILVCAGLGMFALLGLVTFLSSHYNLDGIKSKTVGDGQYMGEMLMNLVPPKNRDIAMVFQNYALYPTMKVFDNIAFPLKMRHWKKEDIRHRVTEIADSLDLSEYLWRRPIALSGGQRQRVALARAMVWIRRKCFIRNLPIFLWPDLSVHRL